LYSIERHQPLSARQRGLDVSFLLGGLAVGPCWIFLLLRFWWLWCFGSLATIEAGFGLWLCGVVVLQPCSAVLISINLG
jgi:hypothetical protein